MDDDLKLARAASEAALAIEGVYSLGTGGLAEAATYGVGEKVSGVIVMPEEVQVHVVLRYPLAKTIPEVAESIKESVGSKVEGRDTTVVVEDLEMSDA